MIFTDTYKFALTRIESCDIYMSIVKITLSNLENKNMPIESTERLTSEFSELPARNWIKELTKNATSNQSQEILKQSADIVTEVDPQNALEHFGFLMQIDSMGLYDDSIQKFYKESCESNPALLIAASRLTQLGILEKSKVKDSLEANEIGESTLNIRAFLPHLHEQLPSFADDNAIDSYKAPKIDIMDIVKDMGIEMPVRIGGFYVFPGDPNYPKP